MGLDHHRRVVLIRPRLSNCPFNEPSVESWLGVSASLGECWVDCTGDVGEYKWALFERPGTETLVLPIGGTFLHENSEGRLAREGVGRVFLPLSLVAVPF